MSKWKPRCIHMRLIQLYLISTVFLSGCTISSTYRQSMPYGPNIQGELHHEKMILTDLAVYMAAHNEIVADESMSLFGFPVSNGCEEISDRFSFGMTLGFLASTTGFTVNLYEINLTVDEDANIRPIKYLYRPHLKGTKTAANKYTKEGLVACGIWDTAYEFKEVKNKPLTLPEIGLWNCYELIFDIPPPDPKKRIILSIKGVKKNGHFCVIPDINFRETKFRHRDFVP
jgi:hypothetical protein